MATTSITVWLLLGVAHGTYGGNLAPQTPHATLASCEDSKRTIEKLMEGYTTRLLIACQKAEVSVQTLFVQALPSKVTKP